MCHINFVHLKLDNTKQSQRNDVHLISIWNNKKQAKPYENIWLERPG